MIPQLGIITSGIKLKTAIVAIGLVISSTSGVSGLDINTAPLSPPPATSKPPVKEEIIDMHREDGLWDYLREGLNYVEASGEEVPIDFVHPGGVAYGPLALTRIAVKDVIIHYEEMSDCSVEEILSDEELYEECGRLYADLLLGHYLKIKDPGMGKEDIFDILQRAWFLGPTIFKDGGEIPMSRQENARQYIKMSAHAGQS